MRPYSLPSTILSIKEDGAVVKITKDERQPFGSLEILLNEAGLERFAGLIDEHNCNGLVLHHEYYGPKESQKYFRPDLRKIIHPESIDALTINGVGKFASDFDFNAFKRFENVRSLTLGEIPTISKVTKFFPKLEVLRIFGWAKNKIQHQDGLWPHLRCLHIVSFRGDLSIFAGWNLQALFLYSAKVESFSSLHSFSSLVTLKTENLNSDIDLSVLNDLIHLKHFCLWTPRHPPKIAGLASQSLEMMMLDKINPDELAMLNFKKDLPGLKLYRIDLGRSRRLDQWDGFRQYGNPFASVSGISPYPPE